MLYIFSKRKFVNIQGGMTYVELIVVLAIFAILAGIVMFDYRTFEDQVEVKNLVNDIALVIVEAQKNALDGRLNAAAGTSWKPAYGVYFDEGTTNNKQFKYFADLNNNAAYDPSDCPSGCLKTIDITKGNYIANLTLAGSGECATPTALGIVFTRPDASAVITSSPPTTCTLDNAYIDVVSPKGFSASIKIYPSGRVQIR